MTSLSYYPLVPTAPWGRFDGIVRPYSVDDVMRTRGPYFIDYTVAELGAQRLWSQLHDLPFVPALGAVTGNQAVQDVRAGLLAIYLSGWQVAADANLAAATYPDQSLYPANSGPALCGRINRALLRAAQIDFAEGKTDIDWLVPIVADAEAGFGGSLNVFEIVKAYIENGAAAIHLEDQLASEKKCGHMGGKVLIPTSAHIRSLVAARLAADSMGVPTIIIARTDAESAKLLSSDVDPTDVQYATGERTPEGLYRLRPKTGLEHAISRGLAYAPYADMLWMETSTPDIGVAREFAEGIHAEFPDKLLAYNCSPSFNWRKNLDENSIATFQEELGAMGYKFQFITLAGFHSLNVARYDLALDYSLRGMTAYADLQDREFALEEFGYTAVRHQHEVGTGYFDMISQIIAQGASSTTALEGSTEKAQF